MEEPPPDQRHPEVRISDADRHAAVELLRQHVGEGRLTLDEFSERVGLVFDARTGSDISQVMADLPAVRAPVPETARRKAKGWTVAIMSGSTRRGRWRPRPRTTAVAVMGGCELDLRQAEIDGPEIVITAIAFMGGIDIIVPGGIEVDMTGVPIMGGKDLRVRDVAPTPGAPQVRVRAFPIMGGVTVRNKGLKDRARDLIEGGETLGALEAGRTTRDARSEARAARWDAREEAREARAARHHHRREGRHGAGPGGGYPTGGPDPTVADRDPGPGTRAPPSPPPAPSVPTPAAGSHAPTGGAPPDLPTAPDGTVTILFSDIAGYTPMTERLGDLRAGELLATHNEIVRGQVSSHDGFEVKSQGDGFMVAFAGAGRALRCAIAIQKAFAERNSAHPDEPIRVHLGLHTGEVLRQGDDFLGRTVIMASRITAEADAGEILVSGLIHELADSSGEFRFAEPREAQLKGISSPQRLYPVIWSC